MRLLFTRAWKCQREGNEMRNAEGEWEEEEERATWLGGHVEALILPD